MLKNTLEAFFVNVNLLYVLAVTAYVTSRFPSVDVSSVKQVLAYKCKENSTALKMKSIRYIWWVSIHRMGSLHAREVKDRSSYSFLIAAIDRTRTRHRGVSPRTSERDSRVRVGCSPPLSFVASSRTLHPIRSTRRSAPGSSGAMVIIVTIIATSSASTDAHGATARKGTEAIRLPCHPRRQVSKSWCLCTRFTAYFILPYERRQPRTFNRPI